ncbi:MAG: hypothetical protein AAB384_04635 [Patescibacteria group bacterium]
MIPLIYFVYVYFALVALLALFFLFTTRLLIATGTFTVVSTTVTGLVIAGAVAVAVSTLAAATGVDWSGAVSFLGFLSF